MKIKDAAAPRRLLTPARGGPLLVIGVLALAINLRSAITSLPPVFPELESALHISAASLALLAAVPVLCFGVFSGSAAPLSRRFGEERILFAAVLLLAAGLLLRGISPRVLLFPGTIVAGAAIALMNVLLPSLVKRRAPERAGLLIGLYLLMLAAGAIVASVVAVPVFNAASGSAAGGQVAASSAAVRVTLALWAAPALVAGLIWVPQLRYATLPEGLPRRGLGRQPGALALRRNALAWQVTLFMGLQSLSYYATLSWFPTMFRDRGVSAAHAGVLLALMNVGNGVTALALPMLAHRAPDQRRLAAVSVAAMAAGLAGAVWGPAGLAPGCMLLLGLGQGASLGLGIFYTMARAPDPESAAALSGFAQGMGYLIASAGPLTIGFVHEVTGSWTVPGLILLLVAGLQLITGWQAGRAVTVPAALRQV